MNNAEHKYNSRNAKKSIVLTPDFVAKNIYDNVKRFPFKSIFDIGAERGNLSQYFNRKKNSKIIGVDIDDEYTDNFSNFFNLDFTKANLNDFKGVKPDLVISNPPFGLNKEYNALYPDIFLKKIFELWGNNIPVILIVGNWFFTNSSKRMKYLNSLKITKITKLHKRTFEACDVNVEASIIYFNIKQKVANDFLDIQKVEKKQKFKTVAFSYKQMEYIKDNIDNFSGEVKELIREKYKDFPI